MRGFGLVVLLGLLASAMPVGCQTSHVGGGVAGAGGDLIAAGGVTSSGGDSGSGGDSSSGAGNTAGNASGGNGGSSTNCDDAGICLPSVCGNDVIEAGEGCDDGGEVPFDGCSATCQIEPECTEDGCVTGCGDGFVVDGEDCDDGNVADQDGCSSTCAIEPGYTCSVPVCQRVDDTCALRLPVVYRDFIGSGEAGGHPDFQPSVNQQTAITGLVEPNLDAEGKPILSATASVANGFMHGADAFAQWYRDTPGFNITIPSEIVLWDNGAGGYVNRWGAAGELWTGQTVYADVQYGGLAGAGCTDCVPNAGVGQCFDPCVPLFSTSSTCCGDASTELYDGNPLFFPIDPPAPGILGGTRVAARPPPEYGWEGYPLESVVATTLGISTPIETALAPFPSATHNFHFTTEIEILFRYESARSLVLEFSGDDDVWVFVNGRLAIDLGGWHPPLAGSLLVDPSSAASYGLEDGGVYSLAVFHAERQTDGSSFRLSLSGLELERSVCVPN